MPEIGLFHFRITYGDSDLEALIKFIYDNANVVIIVHEVSLGGVPHIHCILDGFTQTKSTFFQQFKKLFKLNGNEHFMCKKKNDRDAQLRYVCKGTCEEIPDGWPDVRYFSKLENALPRYKGEDFYKYYHRWYWTENVLLKAKSNEVNMGLQKDSSLVLKTKSKSWTDKTFDEIQLKCQDEIRIIRGYRALYNPTDSERNKMEIAESAIFLLMMRCLGKAAKKFSNHTLFEMFNGFLNGIYCLQLDDQLDPVVNTAATSYQAYLSNRKMGK